MSNAFVNKEESRFMDAARLKAEALNNSRPLDVWRVSEYPEAQSPIDHIYREIVDEGLVKNR